MQLAAGDPNLSTLVAVLSKPELSDLLAAANDPTADLTVFAPTNAAFDATVNALGLQSVDDIIRLFPALSPGINARFNDLRAQGGFLVSAEGSAENVKTLQITSLYGGELRLLSPCPKIEAGKKDQNYSSLKPDQRGVVTIQTKAGDTWAFRRK